MLYHATFKANIPGIIQYGLGARQLKNWTISQTGKTYFTDNPELAFSFCEGADAVPFEKYCSGIVVLAVENLENLNVDWNILYFTSIPIYSWTYSGIISANQLQVVTPDNGCIGCLTELKNIPCYKDFIQRTSRLNWERCHIM